MSSFMEVAEENAEILSKNVYFLSQRVGLFARRERAHTMHATTELLSFTFDFDDVAMEPTSLPTQPSRSVMCWVHSPRGWSVTAPL